MSKQDIESINAIAKELALCPEMHKKVLIDMGLDDEFQRVGTMIRNKDMQGLLRFNELYDRCLRKYAVGEFNDRRHPFNDAGL